MTRAAYYACKLGDDSVKHFALQPTLGALPWWEQDSSSLEKPPEALDPPALPSSPLLLLLMSGVPLRSRPPPCPPCCYWLSYPPVSMLNSAASSGVSERQSWSKIAIHRTDKQSAWCRCARSACASSNCCLSWRWGCTGNMGGVAPQCGPLGACKLFV